eukprot:1080320-Pelagomonas_calceolata.AAC.1
MGRGLGAKECRLDNFLVRSIQAEQAHHMLAIHVIKALLFAQFLFSQSHLPVSSARSSPKRLSAHITTAAAGRNWSAWARTYSFAQHAEQRNSKSW